MSTFRPGFFSKVLAKGPFTTTWVWNLHAEANELVFEGKEFVKYFTLAHLLQFCVVLLWWAVNYLESGLDGNFLVWMVDPIETHPLAQKVEGIVGENSLNGIVDPIGSVGIQSTSGFFPMWRAHGFFSSTQIVEVGQKFLLLCIWSITWIIAWWGREWCTTAWITPSVKVWWRVCFHAVAVGSLISWALHLGVVSLPLSHFFTSHSWMNQTYSLIRNWENQPLWEILPKIRENLNFSFKFFPPTTWRGGLDPLTGSLWPYDMIQHHLALALVLSFSLFGWRGEWIRPTSKI